MCQRHFQLLCDLPLVATVPDVDLPGNVEFLYAWPLRPSRRSFPEVPGLHLKVVMKLAPEIFLGVLRRVDEVRSGEHLMREVLGVLRRVPLHGLHGKLGQAGEFLEIAGMPRVDGLDCPDVVLADTRVGPRDRALQVRHLPLQFRLHASEDLCLALLCCISGVYPLKDLLCEILAVLGRILHDELLVDVEGLSDVGDVTCHEAVTVVLLPKGRHSFDVLPGGPR
mmetsp:Transcript_91690/g.237620  ORF Transcript_91690/g.237620 Transcript_91690/m.237620 type:complete len:224 (-) Transcript_91690:505-1176(-)